MNIKLSLFLCFVISCEIYQLKDVFSVSSIDFFELSSDVQDAESGLYYFQINSNEIGDAVLAETNNIRITERTVQYSNNAFGLFFFCLGYRRKNFHSELIYLKASRFLVLSLPVFLIAFPHYYFT